MSSSAETVLVLVIVLLAGSYLTRRYLRKKRQAKAKGCGGTCGCSATKPKPKKR